MAKSPQGKYSLGRLQRIQKLLFELFTPWVPRAEFPRAVARAEIQFVLPLPEVRLGILYIEVWRNLARKSGPAHPLGRAIQAFMSGKT